MIPSQFPCIRESYGHFGPDMLNRICPSLFIALMLVVSARGQERSYTLRGAVVDSLTGERIPYAAVKVGNVSIGTYANNAGYFVLPGIPQTEKRLFVSAVGYKEKIFVIASDQSVVDVMFQLPEEPTTFSPVEITGNYVGKMKPVEPSTTVLFEKDFAKATGILSNDVVQAITQLPGVVTIGGISSQYYVRGGASDQNLVMVDGIRMYNLFHAFGLFSFVDPLIVKVADMSTGGFQAEYGGRLSSVLAVETKDGDKNNYEAGGSFDLLSSDVVLDGPLPLGLFGGNTSFLGFFRTSLYKNSLQRFFPQSVPFQFFDGFGKITTDLTSSGRLSVEYLSTGDQMMSGNNVDPDFSWRNSGYALTGNYLFGDEYSFQFSVSNSVYNAQQIPKSLSYLHYESNQIIDPAFYGDLTYYPMANERLDFGLLFNFPSYGFTFTNAYGNTLTITQQEAEPNLWVKYKWDLVKDLSVELGLRVDIARNFEYATGAGKGYLGDPRVTVTYRMAPNSTVYIAAGRYHQRIIDLNNEDDIYSPFDLIVPIPDTASNLDDEEAYEYILGSQFSPLNILQFRGEIYYKDFTKLVTVNRDKVDESNPDFVLGTGESYGLELSSQYDIGMFYFTASYSLSKVTNSSDGLTFTPGYDRRHHINISAGFQPWDKFWLRTHWEYGSGLPYTPLSGFYPQLILDPDNLGGYLNGRTSSQIVFGEENSERMTAYHRLDGSVSYEMKVLGLDLTSELMLINIYNRKNVFYINNVNGDIQYSLPFIVDLSLSWRI